MNIEYWLQQKIIWNFRYLLEPTNGIISWLMRKVIRFILSWKRFWWPIGWYLTVLVKGELLIILVASLSVDHIYIYAIIQNGIWGFFRFWPRSGLSCSYIYHVLAELSFGQVLPKQRPIKTRYDGHIIIVKWSLITHQIIQRWAIFNFRFLRNLLQIQDALKFTICHWALQSFHCSRRFTHLNLVFFEFAAVKSLVK